MGGRVNFSVWLIALGVGCAGAIVLPRLGLSRSTERIVFIGGAIALGSVGMAGDALLNRSRRRRVLERLASAGLEAVEGGGAELLGARPCYEPEKEHRNLLIRLGARGRWQGVEIRVFEFTFETGRGKGRTVHCRAQGQTGCPPEWPRLGLVAHHGVLGRPLSKLLASESPGLENAAFNRRWRLECTDAGFARGLLTPEVQEMLAAAPARETWKIHAGRIVCTWEGACAPKDYERMLDRLAILRMLTVGPVSKKL